MFLFNGQYGVASDDNGLYYMRARYYNVSIKRFINQDIVTGNFAESQSLNRYAYVEGNPVSYLDPFGLEKIDTSGLNGTFESGVQGNIGTGIFTIYGQVGQAKDFRGNKDILITLGFGVGPSIGVSGGIFRSITNAPSIKELLGDGYSVGVSAGEVAVAGVDYSIMQTDSGTYHGVSESISGGAGAEIHVGPSYTFKMSDILEKVLDKLIEWYLDEHPYQ